MQSDSTCPLGKRSQMMLIRTSRILQMTVQFHELQATSSLPQTRELVRVRDVEALTKETRFDPQTYRLLLLRRLRLPLPLIACRCRCGRVLDSCGHHRAACVAPGSDEANVKQVTSRVNESLTVQKCSDNRCAGQSCRQRVGTECGDK